jgi:chorismate mutase/prephenate dehydrogenase
VVFLDELTALRERIASSDRRILEILSEREQVAREIGRYKLTNNLPIRNLEVEAEVAERYLDLARELGIGERTAVDLARVTIKDAVEVQSQIMKPSVPKSVLVVGGAGKMGTWLSHYFHSRGHHVIILDPAGVSDFERVSSLQEDVDRFDVIVVATPMSKMGAVLREIVDLQPQGVIFDIASIKTPIIPLLRESASRGIKVCSVHPMFGPDAVSLYDRNVLICDCGSREAVMEGKQLFEGTGVLMLEVEVERHDELMSFVLGLSHAVSLAFFKALAESGFDHETLERAASTTFRKQMDTSRDVAFENPELYFDIQNRNPHAIRALELLGDAVDRIMESAVDGKRESFTKIMEDGREYFGGN